MATRREVGLEEGGGRKEEVESIAMRCLRPEREHLCMRRARPRTRI